jgi:hypothetical protein
VDSVTQHPDSIYNPDPCIDVEEIMEELDGGDHCRLIWINLNVHFFVDDDSTNNLITPNGHVVSEANKLAEDLVNEANYYLYLNEIANKPTWCHQIMQSVPVRASGCLYSYSGFSR